MEEQFERLAKTLAKPEFIVASIIDESVNVYHRYYASTPVTSKYLQVAVKLLPNDAFVLTAFYSSRPKKGVEVWRG
jgi:hypothetical protein